MDKEQAKRLGKWLREQRQERNVSTTRLAKMVDINDGTIVRLEQGHFAKPNPRLLSRIAMALALDLADVYAMAGYDVPEQLPSFQPYLRRKYSDMPAAAIADLDQAFARIVEKHGYEPDGPSGGEDESPDEDDIAADAAAIN
jgi:transcriptional regulator with XRE-family HTH domain